MDPRAFIHPLLALVAAPLLPGLINRTKSFFAGRQGPPVLQLYFDLARLLRKGAVYSRTTSWVFRTGPLVGLAALILALLLVPLGSLPALIKFDGDLIMLAYLMGLSRFATMAAALDTGSSFEGMGASREALVSALAEPGFLLGLLAVAVATGHLTLSGMFGGQLSGPALLLVFTALVLVFLAENSRLPVDDPTTHLELTMIHEVMILDHSGPDLAVIEYASALKMWILGTLAVSALPLRLSAGPANAGLGLLALGVLAILVGTIESSMARLHISGLPRLLVSAAALSLIALFLVTP